jgi:hypothetical protein
LKITKRRFAFASPPWGKSQQGAPEAPRGYQYVGIFEYFSRLEEKDVKELFEFLDTIIRKMSNVE